MAKESRHGAGEPGSDIEVTGGASGRSKRPWAPSARLLVGESNDGPLIDIGTLGPAQGMYGGSIIGDGQNFGRGEVYRAQGRHGTALEKNNK